MRIGLIVLSVGNYGNKGFYNLQEVGLGKALGREGHTVNIYKCVHKNQPDKTEEIAPNVMFHQIGVSTVGNNSVFRCEKVLDDSMDVLVCFSDIQLWTSRVYKWCVRHHVGFIPYVGITHSTSTSAFKRLLINFCAGSAFRTYKTSGVMVKTNAVRRELTQKGITDIQVAPVGIDAGLLRNDYRLTPSGMMNLPDLQQGFRYILMVGRLENDRNPLDVVTVFDALHQADKTTRLIIIGKGSLKEELSEKLAEKHLSDDVIWVGQVPNSDMWQYYRASSALVSFSRTEIFGMSLLEAMYYELPVYVMHAPGPDDIIVDGETGYLFSDPEEMAPAILRGCPEEIGENAHRRVLERFSWGDAVRIVETRAKDGCFRGLSC